MDSDLIQLAAYVVIFIVIGLASVIKKAYEAKKRRQEEEKKSGPSMAQPEKSQGLRMEEETETQVPGPTESETPSETEPPVINLEDVLKKAFGFPGTTESREKPPRIKPQKVWQVKEGINPTAAMEPEQPVLADGAEENKNISVTTICGWDDFTQHLNENGSSELAKAIILTEIIAPPIALRRTRGLSKRIA
ncbi:MAG: hypothetical protein HY811_05845 [Planctomycetes bacterium]|nr:hypothetical protein [Planctomycetota bacterium]